MAVVMTGGTRGLGFVAAQQLTELPGSKLMGVRGDAACPAGWEALPLDLAALENVRTFVATLPDEPITHLILNAGGQRPDPSTRTADGFETTFATNHLAHYLLLRLAMPMLAEGARILVTTSGTHDPREKTGMPAPRHANAEYLAHPDRDTRVERTPTVGGMRAYSSSKLCNLMTALYLAGTEEAQAKGWSILAYDPGLTPGTALVRDQSWLMRTIIWPVLPLVTRWSNGMNTLKDAGRGLADLVKMGQPPEKRVYAALRNGRLTWPDPSDIARDAQKRSALWDDSARLVGLT